MTPSVIAPEIAECRRVLNGDGQDDRTALEILDRWQEHRSADELWATIQPRLKVDYSPRAFVLDVLASGVPAQKLNRVVTELPAVETKTRARNKRHMKEGRYYRAAHEAKLLASVKETRTWLLSREAATAARNYFMAGWRDKFTAMCGQPLDAVVIDLTYIALGVIPKTVRQRQRP